MNQQRPLSRVKSFIKATLQKNSIGRIAVSKVQTLRAELEAKRSAPRLRGQLHQSEKELEVRLRSQLQQSEKEAESVQQWWDKCHSNAGDFDFWLSGSSGNDVWSSLKIEDRIRPGQKLLNIGVGKGHCTRALAERGCQVHALDISPVALAAISNCVVATWLPSQLTQIPSDTFNLAISHLVSQHMSDANLSQQLSEVVRSLDADGVFAMQFAFRLSGNEEEIEETAENIKNGSVCRSLEGMQTMVASAGGRIVWSEKIATFPESNAGWYGIHIKKKA